MTGPAQPVIRLEGQAGAFSAPTQPPLLPPTPPLADVPERYRGVWRRSLLQTPTQRDTDTWVRWLQTASWHADLRVPGSARPGPAPVGLGVPAPTPLQLASQQGFLGRTRVDAAANEAAANDAGRALEICTWERQLDFQPPGCHPDAGRINFDGPDRLIETGVHGDYLEHWERLPGSTGRHAVLERSAPSADGDRPEWLLLSGVFLMRVRPRAAAWPADTLPGDSLAALLERHPAQQAALLDFEIAFGSLREGCWIVERATTPGLEGTVHPLQLRRTSDMEAAVNQGRSLGSAGPWRVHEWSAEGELLR